MNKAVFFIGSKDGAETAPLTLEDILSEKPAGIQQLGERWNKGFNAIFTYMTETVSQFLLSRIKTKDVEAIQESIRRIFYKSDAIEDIRSDYDQQNAFMMGYCHAINQLADTYETEISYEKNESIKTVIASYKHVPSILEILDREFELSHKELAAHIGISEQALSNLMHKIERYHLFHVTRVGKKKYYSIASTNGEAALKIIKKRNGISADGYTKLLLNIMDSLIEISTCDELDRDHVMKQCGKMIGEYTTEAEKCMQKLNELALISKSERVYYVSLILFEGKAKETVMVFTRDFRCKREFAETIVENLKKNVRYQWFFTEDEEQESVEEIQKDLYAAIKSCAALNDRKWESLKKNMHCYMIPKQETGNLLGEIYDAVIYDENEGFSCTDTTIEAKTPYFQMPASRIEMLSEYANKRAAY